MESLSEWCTVVLSSNLPMDFPCSKEQQDLYEELQIIDKLNSTDFFEFMKTKDSLNILSLVRARRVGPYIIITMSPSKDNFTPEWAKLFLDNRTILIKEIEESFFHGMKYKELEYNIIFEPISFEEAQQILLPKYEEINR